MNVLIVMPLGKFGGGAEQMLATYINGSHDKKTLSLHFLFLSDGDLASNVRRLGYPVEVLNAGRLREFGRWVHTQYKIGKIMDRWEIQSVLAWMPKAGLYLAWAVRTRRVPLLMWRHDIPFQIGRIDRWTLRLARVRAVACSSTTAKTAFQNCLSRVPARTIHPGASRLLFDYQVVSQIRRVALDGRRGPIVGTIARLQPWKRIDLLIKATAVLKAAFPELRVVIVGGESHGFSRGYGDELRRLARNLLGDSVFFAGEQRQVGNWIEAMDVFVLPSASEPFGIVLVEAMAAGKPVIACAGGGPEEIITKDVVGKILPPSPTPEQMSDAIKNLLDPNVLNRAHRVNVQVASRFSPQTMISQIDAWLEAST